VTFTSPLAEALAPDVLERFLRYVRVDTQSAREREGSPSTPGQLELGRMLVDELRAAGLEAVRPAPSIPGIRRPEMMLAAITVTVVFGALAAIVIVLLVLVF
jgi:hypothetical protein